MFSYDFIISYCSFNLSIISTNIWRTKTLYYLFDSTLRLPGCSSIHPYYSSIFRFYWFFTSTRTSIRALFSCRNFHWLIYLSRNFVDGGRRNFLLKTRTIFFILQFAVVITTTTTTARIIMILLRRNGIMIAAT